MDSTAPSGAESNGAVVPPSSYSKVVSEVSATSLRITMLVPQDKRI